jgi:hypothetical protein
VPPLDRGAGEVADRALVERRLGRHVADLWCGIGWCISHVVCPSAPAWVSTPWRALSFLQLQV